MWQDYTPLECTVSGVSGKKYGYKVHCSGKNSAGQDVEVKSVAKSLPFENRCKGLRITGEDCDEMRYCGS